MNKNLTDYICTQCVDICIKSENLVVKVALHVKLTDTSTRYCVTMELEGHETFDKVSVFQDYDLAMTCFYDRLGDIEHDRFNLDGNNMALIAGDNYRQLAKYHFNSYLRRTNT